MPLTPDDIERIRGLGYPTDYFVERGADGVPRLRNVNGHCVFLEPSTGRCRIYPWRPVGCRLYPLVCVPGQGVTLDPECPRASRVPVTAVKRLAPYVAELVKRVYGKSLC
jgi:Fe-S-cluster containining protein